MWENLTDAFIELTYEGDIEASKHIAGLTLIEDLHASFCFNRIMEDEKHR